MAKTLLIIEDEALLAKELRRHYQREKWRVLIAGTCAEARRLLSDEGQMPLVVISDMNLPDGNALAISGEVAFAGGATSRRSMQRSPCSYPGVGTRTMLQRFKETLGSALRYWF